ncbi:MAG: hypothetical protein ACWGMZ_07870, partial [Thermoguttaceae bacterium]
MNDFVMQKIMFVKRAVFFCFSVVCLFWASIAIIQEAQAQQSQNELAAKETNKSLAHAKQSVATDDPAVLAILETKPATPAECVRAAKILADLHQPELAKQFLQKVIDAKLDRSALANLGEQFGSTTFISLSAELDLHPQSLQLADAVFEARNAELQSPERLAALIKQLQSTSAEKRSAVFSGLMEAREAGVGALIETLADPKRANQWPAIRTALVAMGRQALGPLLAILDQGDSRQQEQAMAILAELNAP